MTDGPQSKDDEPTLAEAVTRLVFFPWGWMMSESTKDRTAAKAQIGESEKAQSSGGKSSGTKQAKTTKAVTAKPGATKAASKAVAKPNGKSAVKVEAKSPAKEHVKEQKQAKPADVISVAKSGTTQAPANESGSTIKINGTKPDLEALGIQASSSPSTSTPSQSSSIASFDALAKTAAAQDVIKETGALPLPQFTSDNAIVVKSNESVSVSSFAASNGAALSGKASTFGGESASKSAQSPQKASQAFGASEARITDEDRKAADIQAVAEALRAAQLQGVDELASSQGSGAQSTKVSDASKSDASKSNDTKLASWAPPSALRSIDRGEARTSFAKPINHAQDNLKATSLKQKPIVKARVRMVQRHTLVAGFAASLLLAVGLVWQGSALQPLTGSSFFAPQQASNSGSVIEITGSIPQAAMPHGSTAEIQALQAAITALQSNVNRIDENMDPLRRAVDDLAKDNARKDDALAARMDSLEKNSLKPASLQALQSQLERLDARIGAIPAAIDNRLDKLERPAGQEQAERTQAKPATTGTVNTPRPAKPQAKPVPTSSRQAPIPVAEAPLPVARVGATIDR